jgi:hypothetical protein
MSGKQYSLKAGGRGLDIGLSPGGTREAVSVRGPISVGFTPSRLGALVLRAASAAALQETADAGIGFQADRRLGGGGSHLLASPDRPFRSADELVGAAGRFREPIEAGRYAIRVFAQIRKKEESADERESTQMRNSNWIHLLRWAVLSASSAVRLVLSWCKGWPPSST